QPIGSGDLDLLSCLVDFRLRELQITILLEGDLDRIGETQDRSLKLLSLGGGRRNEQECKTEKRNRADLSGRRIGAHAMKRTISPHARSKKYYRRIRASCRRRLRASCSRSTTGCRPRGRRCRGTASTCRPAPTRHATCCPGRRSTCPCPRTIPCRARRV